MSRSKQFKEELDLENIDLVIFDMDGLLLDTERISIDSWIRASKECGFDLDRDLAISRIGTSRKTRDDFYNRHLGPEYPKKEVDKLREKYFQEGINSGKSIVKKGVMEFLDHLDELGIKKAVATSTFFDRAKDLLEINKIYDRFDFVLGGDQVEKPKPNPEGYEKVCKEFNVSKSRALILEDSDFGTLAAFNAGIKYILVKDLKPPTKESLENAYRVVNSICELILDKCA